MWNKPINIGFGNMVPSGRIVALVGNESAPVKRLIQDARERGLLVDATQGRRTRAVIVTDSGHIILSAIQPETIAGRMDQPQTIPAPTSGKSALADKKGDKFDSLDKLEKSEKSESTDKVNKKGKSAKNDKVNSEVKMS